MYRANPSFTFANLTVADLTDADFLSMGIHSARQLGQPQEMTPQPGFPIQYGWVNGVINHVRRNPWDGSPPIPCPPIVPGTQIIVTLDSTRPFWAHIQGPGGLTGWVGRHHITCVPVPAFVSISIPHTHVTATGHITYTRAFPCFTSPMVGCDVPQGLGLIVVAMTSCGQWFKLDGSNTWIPAGWVQ
jgi:hypothetical protein